MENNKQIQQSSQLEKSENTFWKKYWVILSIGILLVLIVLLFSLYYSITGVIISVTNGLPIQNIELKINDRVTKTDIKGKFQFSNLPIYFNNNLLINTQDKYEIVEAIKDYYNLTTKK